MVVITCFPREDVRIVRVDELRVLYAMVNRIKFFPVKFMDRQWLENFLLVGPVECTSLITRIAQSLGLLNWAKFSYIESPRSFINENYLVFGHTLKHARDGSLIFFFPGYTNKFWLPNPNYHLYNCRSLTFELRTAEVARGSSVRGRMTRSMLRNAAMNMSPPHAHAFHSYEGTWAQTADVTGSSSRYQPSWDQYIPWPDVGASSWQSAGNSKWHQHGGGRTGAMVARV